MNREGWMQIIVWYQDNQMRYFWFDLDLALKQRTEAQTDSIIVIGKVWMPIAEVNAIREVGDIPF